LVFLPEIPIENNISIIHAKIRKGNPSSIAISENLNISSAEIYGERKDFITA
jgi:hypothetical protein